MFKIELTPVIYQVI